MGVQQQLILTACIVNAICTSVEPHYQTTTHDSFLPQFQNFFDSVTKNNVEKKDNYIGILKEEESRGRRAFAEMKEELWSRQYKNAFKRKHFVDQMNTDKNIVARKRETNENNPAETPHITLDQNELRTLFRKFYPEPKNLTTETWHDVESLTTEKLQSICDQVFEQFRDKELAAYRKEYNYTPVDPVDLLIFRVIRSAPFSCDNKVITEFYQQEGLTVAICLYDKMKFFVAPAGDKHFFRLNKNEHSVFKLKSGLHPVNWK